TGPRRGRAGRDRRAAGPEGPDRTWRSAMSRDLTVAIIGVGSRGLSVLERILTLAKRAGPAIGRITVALVDPRCDGAGVHATDQPDYLLLNTTCAQVSMFPDAATVGDELDAPGPSLYEWATARGLRLA